ncbi:MAG: HNH endonuclease signature motif containing protein, partial [Lapillicoccus sp.]
PRRTRRLAEDRDRGCRFPGCGATAHVEVHHLVPWSHGGRTDLGGLVCLCPHHHDRHHAGDLAIEGVPSRPDGLRFRNRFGALIRPGPTFARPAAVPSGATYHGPTGERLHSRWVSFHPPPVPSVAS